MITREMSLIYCIEMKDNDMIKQKTSKKINNDENSVLTGVVKTMKNDIQLNAILIHLVLRHIFLKSSNFYAVLTQFFEKFPF